MNIMMMGDSEVGKRSILKLFNNKIQIDTKSNTRTVGLDVIKVEKIIDGNGIVVQLWDTAG